MSKELRRLKDFLDGYQIAVIGNSVDVEIMVGDIKTFIDVLIRDSEIAEHEAKKILQACREHGDYARSGFMGNDDK